MVISGFPGIGKSWLFANADALNIKATDSDSSAFSWVKTSEGTTIRNPEFPDNYIEHIKEVEKENDIVMVSSHKEVRDALLKNNIKFVLVYPHISLKNEYIKRYTNRGNKEGFIYLLENNWEKWISEIEKEKGYKKIVLTEPTDYLYDVIKTKNLIEKIK